MRKNLPVSVSFPRRGKPPVTGVATRVRFIRPFAVYVLTVNSRTYIVKAEHLRVRDIA